jgi:hypothetical protein
MPATRSGDHQTGSRSPPRARARRPSTVSVIDETRDRFDGWVPQGCVEVGLSREPEAVLADLDLVAAAEGEPRPRAKSRTGGTVAKAFPTDSEFAVGIVGAARRGLPVKLTAGLHDPARHRDLETGFEHHGLLNVLLAVDAAVRGAGSRRSASSSPFGTRQVGLRPSGTCRRIGRARSVGTCCRWGPAASTSASPASAASASSTCRSALCPDSDRPRALVRRGGPSRADPVDGRSAGLRGSLGSR